MCKTQFNLHILITFFILILVVAFSYSIFDYQFITTNNNLILGELYLNYSNGNTITLDNVIPSDTYPEAYFEFSINGKNTSSKDVLYEISLSHGSELSNKIRIDDRFLRFRLVEVIDNTEEVILNDAAYSSINNTTIHVDGIKEKTLEEVNKVYRLYVWINGVLIGNLETADYTSEEWENIYANINVNVRANTSTKTYRVNYHPNRLPDEYQEVEYIESFGNEYIITDIIPQEEMGISIKYLNSNLNSEQVLIGASNLDNSSYLIGTINDKIYYGWNLINKNLTRNTDENNIKSLLFNYLNNKKVELNDEILVSNLEDIDLNITSPISVFALNKNDNITLNSSIKLYELKISLNDELKYNFVPCYNKNNNEVGLYEIITGKFYSSSGSGELKNGKDKVISQYMIYDNSHQLKENIFENKYEFYRWNTTPSGIGDFYTSKEVVKNLTNPGEVIDLYALWSNRLVIENAEVIENNFSNITINSYNKTMLNSSIELSQNNNLENTNVILNLTLSNNSPYIYSFSHVDFSLDKNYDNENIIFDLIGLKNGDILNSGDKLTFKLKFRYKNIDNVVNNKLNSNLNFVFNNLSGIELNKLIISNEENNVCSTDKLYKYNNKYYFSGVDVDNYLWFNCDDGYDSGEEHCEKWRILSIDEQGNVKITKDNVIEKQIIEKLEKETKFWVTNTSEWMTNTKVLAEGRILFDIKNRRPSNVNLENSYCYRTSNGCNAYATTTTTTGFYKDLIVDSDSLAKKYLDEVYYVYGISEESKNYIMNYPFNDGLVSTSLSLDNILINEASVKINANIGLINLSDYLYANTNTSCWYDFSKCTNNSSNNWLTLPDTPYYLLNGKIVGTNISDDKHAQIWTVKSNGLVSHDANNEYFLRPVVILKNNVKAIGLGNGDEYYIIVS